MYSKEVVKANLRRIQATLPFRLVPRTIEEARYYVAHFDSLLDEDGILTRDLKPDEIEYIQGERILCKYDFRYFCTRYVKIKSQLVSKDEQVILLPFNIGQRMTLDIYAQMEEGGRTIVLIQLKARQLGISTITEFVILHRALFYSNINALIASSTPNKSRKMADMMLLALENMPYWLKPEDLQIWESGEDLMWSQSLRSGVSVQHGNKTTGIARGETPNVFHLSEVSEFENAEDLIDASLMRAFHADRRNFGVLESTAEGMGNWWETTWLASTEGLTRFTPLFLPWFVGTDLYPTGDWLVERPIPENYAPIPEALKHAERAADYTRTQPLLRRYLGDDWQMPTEQIWFWEFNYKDAKRRKLLNKFYQEMPAEPMEAFQASNMMVFEPDEIADFARNRKPLHGCYGVVGTGIPERLWPHKREIDPSREILTVRADWMQGGAVMSFQFVPLRYEGFPSCPWENRVFIWELPNDTSEYTVGVDTSYGMGQDRSVIEVLRKGSVFQASEQVLEYANAYVNSMDLAPITIAIATLYSRPRAKQPEQCKVAIEVMGNGETTQLEMIKIGWSNFHRWERYDKIRQQQSHPSEKKGWYTNSWSRPMLIDRVNRAIRDGALQLNSPWLIEELKTLSKDEFQQAIKAEYGKFDDRYMAGAIAYFSGDVWDHMFGGDEAGASSKQERERKLREREAWESQTTPNFDFGLPTLDGDFDVTDYGLPVRKTWKP